MGLGDGADQLAIVAIAHQRIRLLQPDGEVLAQRREAGQLLRGAEIQGHLVTDGLAHLLGDFQQAVVVMGRLALFARHLQHAEHADAEADQGHHHDRRDADEQLAA
ncbi:hypothetical protein D3C77_677880 [compost metagenome]